MRFFMTKKQAKEQVNGSFTTKMDMEKSGFYKDGKKTGVLKYFYKSGQVERVGSYEDGQKVGEWHCYKEDGELIMTENY